MCAVISDIYHAGQVQLCMHPVISGTQRPQRAFMRSSLCRSSATVVQRPLQQVLRSVSCPSEPVQHMPQHGNRPTAQDCKPLRGPSMFAPSSHAAAKVSNLFLLAGALLRSMRHHDITAIACCIPACVAMVAQHF
jgi:hypothetical protein